MYVQNISGQLITARALLDADSNNCYVSSEFSKLLKIKQNHINVSVSCLNDLPLQIKWKITATITNNSDYKKTLDFLIVPKITNFIPGHYFKFPFSQLPQGIKLADPEI